VALTDTEIKKPSRGKEPIACAMEAAVFVASSRRREAVAMALRGVLPTELAAAGFSSAFIEQPAAKALGGASIENRASASYESPVGPDLGCPRS
jgi:hypothetical protein